MKPSCSMFAHKRCRYVNAPTVDAYATIMKKHGLQPETVDLPHDTKGLWIGNKDAKKVVVYYHGSYSILTRVTPPPHMSRHENLIPTKSYQMY